jgi:hypothetical protein
VTVEEEEDERSGRKVDAASLSGLEASRLIPAPAREGVSAPDAGEGAVIRPTSSDVGEIQGYASGSDVDRLIAR